MTTYTKNDISNDDLKNEFNYRKSNLDDFAHNFENATVKNSKKPASNCVGNSFSRFCDDHDLVVIFDLGLNFSSRCSLIII